MKHLPINLRSDQRTTIIGGTGDGKTTLAEKLIANIAQTGHQKVVIFNPGMEPRLYEDFGNSRVDIDTKWPDVQHIAPPVTKNPHVDFDPIFWEIVKRGNVLLYIDELFICGTASRYPLAMQYIYQAGRRRNIGVVGITQRPKTVPVFCFTQADHFFVGNVMGNDLKTVENYTSQSWRDIVKQRKQYEFLYWSRHEQLPPRVVKL